MATNKVTMASLKRDVARLTAELESAQKDASTQKAHKDMYYKNSNEYQAEINAVHDLLDVLPNTIERKRTDGYSEHKLMTRLASFLANRSAQ